MRDFTFEATKAADEEEKKQSEAEEFNRLQQLLINWCGPHATARR